MKFVNPLLKRVVYPLLSKSGYLRRYARRGGLAVITYHGVMPSGYVPQDPLLDGNLVTINDFRAQLRFLKTQYSVVSPDRVREWLVKGRNLPERAVLLTCDDGLQNTLCEMLSVLKEENLSCLFFITGASLKTRPEMLWYEQLYLILKKATSRLESLDPELCNAQGKSLEPRKVWWFLVNKLSGYEPVKRSQRIREIQERVGAEGGVPEANSPEGRRFLLLTSSEVRELAAQGMTIGAHSLSHPMLSRCSAECAKHEIVDSKSELESLLGQPVWAFAYPFGTPDSISMRELVFAKDGRFEAAFVNTGGGLGATLQPFAIPRIHMTVETSLSELDAHVSGFYRWIRGSAPLFNDASGLN